MALVVAAGLAAAVGIGGPALLRHPTRQAAAGPVSAGPDSAGASRCPAVGAALQADLDGDGCPSAVTWEANVVSTGGRRYQLGRPGDALLLGDWDCDGRDTPALYRPATGQVFLFPAWAGPGPALAATDGGSHRVGGAARVAGRKGGCDRVVVEGGTRPPPAPPTPAGDP